ncbi:hypothetical protein E4634_07400 [Mangrovimicrobium sediminis]|uniref:Calcium-binding protein n=1 Tax=Mangrovimicrobium sediminis TaxID=2562682 RepID=A0A4Z0M3D9_9GAMM|nr:hypothetical protein [Haliea sp. SAOS-164]TGD73960.1 hypothetical protein E4634_07400 [Haliea sp. SAOS-164]
MVVLRLLITLSLLAIGVSPALAASPQTAPATAQQLDMPLALRELQGLDDPSLAFGLNGVADWNAVLPFIDLVKSMRPWLGHVRGRWGGLTAAQMREGGFLDEHGWLTRMPPGIAKVSGVFAWSDTGLGLPDVRAGRYVMLYAGSGSIEIANAEVVAREPGRIVFDIAPYPGNWWFDIVSVDPSDHLRDIRIVRESQLALYRAGAIFNPDWLELVADARLVRFMDWMGTNNSPLAEPDDRVDPAYYTWFGQVPIEVQVRLANEIGADPWFNIPHLASDALVEEFASYVRDNLDPRLQAYVEFSNETWNWQFQQTHQLVDAGKALWGNGQVGVYYTMRASQVMRIWDGVFGEQADKRLVKVLAGQAVNTWLSNILISADLWRRLDPDNWRDPASTFDAFAVTTYFGGQLSQNAQLRDQLLAMPHEQAFPRMRDNLLDPDTALSIPVMIDKLRAQKALANKAGLRLVLYEGGQHHHHAEGGATKDERYNNLMLEFVRSQEMADLYQRVWDAWAALGQGSFMQFVESGPPSQYGSWGLRVNPRDNPPRARLLDQLNRETPAWWESRAGSHFQHGAVVSGSDAAETLVGTAAEDYLLGGGGDDVLLPGPGDDGINGGEGEDVVVLAGDPPAYRLSRAGEGYLVSGPGGRDYLFAAELLQFADASRCALDATAVSRASAPQAEPPCAGLLACADCDAAGPAHAGR